MKKVLRWFSVLAIIVLVFSQANATTKPSDRCDLAPNKLHKNINSNANNNSNKNTNTNMNYNNNSSKSTSSSNSSVVVKNPIDYSNNISQNPQMTVNEGATIVTINDAKNLINTPSVDFQPYPLIQSGAIHNYPQMPKIWGITPYNGETIIEVTVHAWRLNFRCWFWLSRIHFQDIEPMLIDIFNQYSIPERTKLRYKVLALDGAEAWGIGGGGTAAGITNSGLVAGTASILPGMSRSDYDPTYTIFVYKIEQ